MVVALAVAQQVKQDHQHQEEIDYEGGQVLEGAGYVADHRVAGEPGRLQGDLGQFFIKFYSHFQKQGANRRTQARMERDVPEFPDSTLLAEHVCLGIEGARLGGQQR